MLKELKLELGRRKPESTWTERTFPLLPSCSGLLVQWWVRTHETEHMREGGREHLMAEKTEERDRERVRSSKYERLDRRKWGFDATFDHRSVGGPFFSLLSLLFFILSLSMLQSSHLPTFSLSLFYSVLFQNPFLEYFFPLFKEDRHEKLINFLLLLDLSELNQENSSLKKGRKREKGKNKGKERMKIG